MFLAIPIAYRYGGHMSVESLQQISAAKFAKVFDMLIELLWIWFAVSLAWLAWRVSEVAKLQSSPGLELPMNYVYYSMVVGGVYLLLVALRRMFRKEPFKRQYQEHA